MLVRKAQPCLWLDPVWKARKEKAKRSLVLKPRSLMIRRWWSQLVALLLVSHVGVYEQEPNRFRVGAHVVATKLRNLARRHAGEM